MSEQPNNSNVDGVKYDNSKIRVLLVIFTIFPILFSFILVITSNHNGPEYLICASFICINLILTKFIFGKRLVGIKWYFTFSGDSFFSFDFPSDQSIIDPKDTVLFTWFITLPLPYWFVVSFFIGNVTDIGFFFFYMFLFTLQVLNAFIYLRGYNNASKKWEEVAKSVLLGNVDRFQELPDQYTIENPEGVSHATENSETNDKKEDQVAESA